MDLDARYRKLPEALLPWYHKHARDLPWRQDRQAYHIWLSEIMLQQTRVEAVRDYYQRFVAELPTIEALAQVEEARLLKLWEGLGYYSRARNLHKAAQQIVHERNGCFPSTYEEILALPGVGPYTAGAIASICFEQPVAAVDGNVLRVLSRIGEDFSPIDLPKTRREMSIRLSNVYPKGACGDFTQAMMELGAMVCLPKSPRCSSCPAADFCLAQHHSTQAQLPVRLPKREKRVEQRTVLLLQCQDKLAIQKREEEGLLSGLWELPNFSGALSPDMALGRAAQLGVQAVELCQELHRVHIFTHIRWEMVCYHILCKNMAAGLVWATQADLQKDYALPTAFRIFLQAAGLAQ